MRQQEGVDDDNEHGSQLDRGNHQEGYRCEERDDDKEVDHKHQACCLSVGIT